MDEEPIRQCGANPQRIAFTRLKPHQFSGLRRLSEERERSRSFLIREAVERYLRSELETAEVG
jgi:predicted transcriptional regulator